MTYEESSALMGDAAFRGRIKVAVIKFADYILAEDNTTPAHNTRVKWAQAAYQNPDMVAAQIQSAVVMDTAVQAAGAEIDDAALQGAVETTVNKLL